MNADLLALTMRATDGVNDGGHASAPQIRMRGDVERLQKERLLVGVGGSGPIGGNTI